MKIYFPEYKDALGKVDGAFSLELLKSAPFPADLKALDENGIRQIWHEAKLRGRGYSKQVRRNLRVCESKCWYQGWSGRSQDCGTMVC